MNIDTFFTDHWKEIEPERITRYEEMFVWHDAQRLLVEGAGIAVGHQVVDLGSGPGFFASGLAQIVGDAGRVHGVDINGDFIDSARSRFSDHDNMTFYRVEDHRLPFDDGQVDRTSDWGINDHSALVEKMEAKDTFKTELSEAQIQNLADYFVSLPSEVAMKLWTVAGAEGNVVENCIKLHQTTATDGTLVTSFIVEVLSGGQAS